ncbi:MAG TPA: 50S ribosomal protein L21 [Anaerolineae bacterium]|nr:50S ribosomal protein L21 [Anaerolineae bacterium]
MYAVVETGGKQYKVAVGDTVDVERMPVSAGETVELDRVLLVADGDRVMVGQPLVEGARVRATVLDEVKGKKVIVFKYRPKVRYRRKTGHRQRYTRLRIDEIVV